MTDNNVQDAIYYAKHSLCLAIAKSEHPDAQFFYRDMQYISPESYLTLEYLFEKCKEFGIYKEIEINFR